ncbi:hypothetical protein CVIRNUC_002272 [Coccomyxa viridis]|uniref:Uncharacterized protein n=1 Tax=Coccomyxa viridis TaxID=1274662 RepID=A0AAV1HYC2_9CHLO|nr:hypothetical protein CVIRNUC_002272 [Coccomyxa viridis]
MEEVKEYLGVHPRMPNWETAHMGTFQSLAISIAVPVVAGFLVSMLGQKEILTWYRTLNKPSWQPPAFLFGPVWTTIYTLCGLCSWLVWTHGGFEKQRAPLTLYGINMLFNLAWNPTFFFFHAMQVAFWDAAGIVVTLALVIPAFYQVEPLAGLLMLPYLAWATFALYLNSTLINMNPQEFTPKELKASGEAGVKVE